MPAKLGEQHEVLIKILYNLACLLGHDVIRQLKLTADELGAIGVTRFPISLLHKISLMNEINKGTMKDLTPKQIAAKEGISVKKLYRIYEQYYSKDSVFRKFAIK